MATAPEVTYLGTTEGEWPVHAFISEGHASYWAAEVPTRRHIWPVVSITLGPPMRGERIPARQILVPVSEPDAPGR